MSEISNKFFEVYRNGEPTNRLFFTEENARLWINTHGTDGALYSIKPYFAS